MWMDFGMLLRLASKMICIPIVSPLIHILGRGLSLAEQKLMKQSETNQTKASKQRNKRKLACGQTYAD